jgi:hypothetical protein
MRKIYLFLIIINTLLVNAQITQQWVNRYNGLANSYDAASRIAVDNSGNVIVTGSSTYPGQSSNFCTIKYNPSGIQQWIAMYNGPGNSYDNALFVFVDDSSNIYIVGNSYSGSATGTDIVTIKYNPSGVQQWLSVYNGTGNGTDNANYAVTDNSGNIYITGSTTGAGTSLDYCTIKYNSAGVQQWSAVYNGPGNNDDNSYSIAVDNAGNVYITGGSRNGTTMDSKDFATIKYNSAGVQQWVVRYNGQMNREDHGSSIAVMSGDVYVIGSEDVNYTLADLVTIKYNSSGVQQWLVKFNGPANNFDYATKILPYNDSFIYVLGSSIGIGTSADYVIIKYNTSGIQQWNSRYSGAANGPDYPLDMAVDFYGNAFITGRSFTGSSQDDYLTVKFNPLGVQQWAINYNGPNNGSDMANALAIDDSGSVFVAGYSRGDTGAQGYDYATIKYSIPVGLINNTGTIPSYYNLSQSYPNPFNPVTSISYSIPRAGHVELKIYNVLGEETAVLVNEMKQPGIYKVNFDASNYASGVYFYRITSGDFTDVKKMVVIK